MPAVSPIAMAPHTTTRTAPTSGRAPPVRAASHPRPPKHRSDAAATAGTSRASGVLLLLGRAVRGQLPTLALEIGSLRVRLGADRDVLAGRHGRGARDEAGTPAMSTADRLASAAATPTSKLAVETIPSLAPSTAARSQPMRSVRCCSRCRERTGPSGRGVAATPPPPTRGSGPRTDREGCGTTRRYPPTSSDMYLGSGHFQHRHRSPSRR
jgi:hypothetical protein